MKLLNTSNFGKGRFWHFSWSEGDFDIVSPDAICPHAFMNACQNYLSEDIKASHPNLGQLLIENEKRGRIQLRGLSPEVGREIARIALIFLGHIYHHAKRDDAMDAMLENARRHFSIVRSPAFIMKMKMGPSEGAYENGMYSDGELQSYRKLPVLSTMPFMEKLLRDLSGGNLFSSSYEVLNALYHPHGELSVNQDGTLVKTGVFHFFQGKELRLYLPRLQHLSDN